MTGRVRRRTASLALLAITSLAGAARAQEIGAAPPASRQGPGERGMDPRRQQLERQLRQNFWKISKERIGLTDQQMQRLGETSRRFDVRRRALFQDERAQRQILRSEILADARADQGRISTALDRLLELQRQRVDMLADEQRELATFMTPIQRAKFGALQEQVRRRMDALRRERPDSTRVLQGAR